MDTVESTREREELQRVQERLMRKAAQEVIKKRPKESCLGGNPNPCKLSLPKRRKKV